MATQTENIIRQSTKELYRKIYRHRVMGLNHSQLVKKFKCSKTTVVRAILWAHKWGLNELPKDDELLNNIINDIQFRRAYFASKLFNLDTDEQVKVNKTIQELDNQALILRGIIASRGKDGNEINTSEDIAEIYKAYRKIPTETLNNIIKFNKKTG